MVASFKDDEIHIRRVALSIDSKIKELDFFLDKIKEEYIGTSQQFVLYGQIRDDEILNRINYYFSAFANTVQSLKDMLETVIRKELPWSNFKSVPYFDFIKNGRNAITTMDCS